MDSEILTQNLIYKKGQALNNELLRTALIKEQKGYCAYSEKHFSKLDSPEVEHFDSSKKYKNDDYYNYYAVIRRMNQDKVRKDAKYAGNSFFTTLFFQDPTALNQRLGYADGYYYAKNKDDQEAKDLIDYLGFNDSGLYQERKNHISMLRDDILYGLSKEDKIQYLSQRKHLLSFITAIEAEFDLDLSSLLQ